MTEARRNFYGRRKGHALRGSQQARLDTDLARLSPGPVSVEANPHRVPLDPAGIGGGAPLWLEIGFGGGEHLVHQAVTNPGVHLIGAEPYINGVAMLLGKIAAAGVTNLSVHPGDVRDLMDVLPDACIERAFLLYPDPWPKARHHRRRFVTPGHLAPLARVMAPGAVLRIASDIPDYMRQARAEVSPQGFAPVSDGTAPWTDWIPTRYEVKARREGRVPHYLTYRREGALDRGEAAR